MLLKKVEVNPDQSLTLVIVANRGVDHKNTSTLVTHLMSLTGEHIEITKERRLEYGA